MGALPKATESCAEKFGQKVPSGVYSIRKDEQPKDLQPWTNEQEKVAQLEEGGGFQKRKG